MLFRSIEGLYPGNGGLFHTDGQPTSSTGLTLGLVVSSILLLAAGRAVAAKVATITKVTAQRCSPENQLSPSTASTYRIKLAGFRQTCFRCANCHFPHPLTHSYARRSRGSRRWFEHLFSFSNKLPNSPRAGLDSPSRACCERQLLYVQVQQF